MLEFLCHSCCVEVCIFPLKHVVFHPGSTKPLNVFEPRYIAMVQKSLSSGIPIALANVDGRSAVMNAPLGVVLDFVNPIAGYGMPRIVEERADGSMLVFMHSQGKLKLGEVSSIEGNYIMCKAERIEEELKIQPASTSAFMSLQKLLVGWLEKHIVDVQPREQFINQLQTPSEILGACVSYLVADPDMQQLILETNDINEKIKILLSVASNMSFAAITPD